MSILIKGMDMPKGCVDPKSKGMACPVLLWCTAWRDKVAPPLHRPQDCPLVEVPTPHGRLLDENDVKNTFKFSEDAEYARWTLAGVFMDIEDTEAVLESEE